MKYYRWHYNGKPCYVIPCEEFDAMQATQPADAALADDALCESLIEESDMRWNGDVYVGDGADLMNLVRAALRARAVHEGFALVPVEPTNEMYHAGVNAISSVWMNPEGTAPVGGYGAYVRRVWPAMLAASKAGGG